MSLNFDTALIKRLCQSVQSTAPAPEGKTGEDKFLPLFDAAICNTFSKISEDDLKDLYVDFVRDQSSSTYQLISKIYLKIREFWQSQAVDKNAGHLAKLFWNCLQDYNQLKPEKFINSYYYSIAQRRALRCAVEFNLHQEKSLQSPSQDERQELLNTVYQLKMKDCEDKICKKETQEAMQRVLDVRNALEELKDHPLRYNWISSVPRYYYVNTIYQMLIKAFTQGINGSFLKHGGVNKRSWIEMHRNKLKENWNRYANEQAYGDVKDAVLKALKERMTVYFYYLNESSYASLYEHQMASRQICEHISNFSEGRQKINEATVQGYLASVSQEDVKVIWEELQMRLSYQQPAAPVLKHHSCCTDGIIREAILQKLVAEADEIQGSIVLDLKHSLSMEVLSERLDGALFAKSFKKIIEHLSDEAQRPDIQKIAALLNEILSYSREMIPELNFLYKPSVENVLKAKGYTNIIPIDPDMQGCEATVLQATKDGIKYAVKVFISPKNFHDWNAGKAGEGLSIHLKHPHLIKTCDVVYTESVKAVVMPWCENQTLFDCFKDCFFQPGFDAKFKMYSKQILEALAYLHSMGIVHHDVKIENFLIDGDTAYLSDYGFLSRIDPFTKGVNIKMGTIQYMAPEYHSPHGTPFDMWSMGVCLYICAKGRSPDWERKNFCPCEGEIERILLHINDLKLRDLLSKCFVPDPKKRITASEALLHEYFRS